MDVEVTADFPFSFEHWHFTPASPSPDICFEDRLVYLASDSSAFVLDKN